MMNKIIGAAVLLLCFCSCVKDNDAIYYPVGNVDIEKGGPALEVGSNSILVAESYNEEDYVLDTLAQYPVERQIPVYTSADATASYAIKLRLKGELTLTDDEWMIDYVYAQLAGLFQPYPPASFPEVFMCKGGEQSFATFDSFRRTWTFDITYDHSELSFSQLYFNLFVNLAGQKREDRIRLRIDKDSYFKIYKIKEEM